MARVNTLNQEQIKEINRVNIINILRSKGETTKQEVAQMLGLSIPTVTTNINVLMEDGLVSEAGVARSTGGRKPVILRFEENARYSFGVDITPERIRIVLVNLNLKVIDEQSFDYKKVYSFSDVLDQTEIDIKGLLRKNKISKKLIVGVGISLPGLVDEDRLILENSPNIGVRDFDFGNFAKKLGLKVSIENEANIAAFAEATIGVGKKKSNMVYISITEGVGTGIIINDHIYKSSHKKAGEFGHMRVSGEDKKCNCGRTGCWELFASKKALIRYYQEETGKSVHRLSDVFEGAAKGDPKVLKAVRHYIKELFVGIENIILGLNPEYVIIGGELGNYAEILLSIMGEHQNLKSSYINYEGTKVLFTSLGDKSALMGASLLPLEEIFNYRKSIL